jgi:hypothetical protein
MEDHHFYHWMCIECKREWHDDIHGVIVWNSEKTWQTCGSTAQCHFSRGTIIPKCYVRIVPKGRFFAGRQKVNGFGSAISVIRGGQSEQTGR